MKYQVKFPSSSIQKKFMKILNKISVSQIQDEIMDKVEALADNPRPAGQKIFKKIKPPIEFYNLTANYRLRVGDYRILYDIDDDKKIVWILALRRRSDQTYS
jgi:mRNA interferase RelE/StbE